MMPKLPCTSPQAKRVGEGDHEPLGEVVVGFLAYLAIGPRSRLAAQCAMYRLTLVCCSSCRVVPPKVNSRMRE